jgi:ribokinase
LEAVRKRDGLTPRHVEQLVGGRVPDVYWETLAKSALLRALQEHGDRSFYESIKMYCQAVAGRLPRHQRWAVDFALALGVPGVDAKYEPQLGPTRDRHHSRRTQAMEFLRLRADDLEAEVTLPAGVSTYVAKIEDPALRAFAELLAQPDRQDFEHMGLNPTLFIEFLSRQIRPLGTGPNVVVLGGAVMDLNFRVPYVPEDGASVQALSYLPFPGGKGLTQAVACARLGLRTSLVSIVGDDVFGHNIIDFLNKEGVCVDCVEVRKGVQSMVTGVLTKEDSGGSFAIGWKNERELFFSKENLRDCGAVTAIAQCDFLLTSFELPSGTVTEALEIAKKTAKATTIVTPAPPYAHEMLDAQHRKNMDYLVANTWELTQFARAEQREIMGPDQIDKLARPLVVGRRGVRNLLVTHHPIWHAYLRKSGGDKLDEFPVVWPTKEYESAGDRDAFCAMLAMQLHLVSIGETSSIRRGASWAAAAMAAREGGLLSVPDSMPTFDDVREVVEHGDFPLPE